MTLRFGTPGPARLPRILRRREAERRRVEAFVAAIRRSADPHSVPAPRPVVEPPTNALPMSLVTLLVSPR